MQNNDSSSEDDVYETLSNFHQLINCCQDKQLQIQILNHLSTKTITGFQQIISDFKEEPLLSKCYKITMQMSTLIYLEYYEENKDKLVYKRFDQLDLGKRCVGERLYFASLLANFKKTYPRVIFRGENLLDQKSVPVISETIQFDSNFESGNLFCAFQRQENSFDLILQNDINTRGNTQWFFFLCLRCKSWTNHSIQTLNHLKSGSLFNEGLQPAIYSMKKMNQIIKSGLEVDFRQVISEAHFKRNCQSLRKYYQLRFSYTFKHDNDKVYFAHSYPYTYTNLVNYLNGILVDPDKSQYISRKELCHTLGGNSCDVLTITSNQLQRRAYRKGVVFMARQHPGEPQGSW
ncbi:hypothetical protein pb186bvf_011371 [Paramecium bursaria]